jgi:hypothetical protein
MDRPGWPPPAGLAPGAAAAVKFLRQFAAAAAVVAIVVLGGLAWNRLHPSLPGEGPAASGPALVVRGHIVKGVLSSGKLRPGVRVLPGGKLPPGVAAGTRGNERSGISGLMLGDLLEPVNLAVLRHTAFLEAAVIAAVVILDIGYRRLRRARRVKT